MRCQHWRLTSTHSFPKGKAKLQTCALYSRGHGWPIVDWPVLPFPPVKTQEHLTHYMFSLLHGLASPVRMESPPGGRVEVAWVEVTVSASSEEVRLVLRRNLNIIGWMDELHLLQCISPSWLHLKKKTLQREANSPNISTPMTFSWALLSHWVDKNSREEVNSNPGLSGFSTKYWLNSNHSVEKIKGIYMRTAE